MLQTKDHLPHLKYRLVNLVKSSTELENYIYPATYNEEFIGNLVSTLSSIGHHLTCIENNPRSEKVIKKVIKCEELLNRAQYWAVLLRDISVIDCTNHVNCLLDEIEALKRQIIIYKYY